MHYQKHIWFESMKKRNSLVRLDLHHYDFSPTLEFLEALLLLSSKWSLPFNVWSSLLLDLFVALQWAQWTQISACEGPNFLAIKDLNFNAGPSFSPSLKVKWSSVRSGSADPSMLCSRKTWKKVEKRCNKTKISILNCFNVILVIRQFTISSIKETWALVNFRCRKFLIFNQRVFSFKTYSFVSKSYIMGVKKEILFVFTKKKILINFE